MVSFITTSIIIIFYPYVSYAYIDPITGSIVIQAIIGGVVTALFFIKTYWKKLINLFKKPSDKDTKDSKEGETKKNNNKDE